MHDDDDYSDIQTIDIGDIHITGIDDFDADEYTVGSVALDSTTGIISAFDGTQWNTITTNNTGGIYFNDTITSVDPTMRVDGDLVVNGRNVMEELDIVKTLLDGAVIQRDPAMETEFKKLKELADEYQKQLEKYKTFKSLKDSK